MAKAAKQVTVDEAVAKKGGKTAFVKSLEDATGVTAANERAEQAAEHFDRRVVEPDRRVLPLECLVAMAHNPRLELGDVSTLVQSIERNGFIGALSVRELDDGRFEVWAGNRRLKAAQVAGLTDVPCDVYELTEVQALELNLTEQINRSDLTPLEEGEACRRLMEISGYSVQQVAEKLGQSVSWVRGRVALCNLAGEVKKGLKAKTLTLTVAQALAALPSQKMQAQALDKVDGLTAEEALESLRTKFCRPLQGIPWKMTDAMLVAEAGACGKCPHNSANNLTPGLFDNVKAKPTCSNLPCFEGKVRAAWERDTAKAKAAGAKVLPISEGHKLFAHGTLGYDSRYVEAGQPVSEDRNKRTWGQLVGEMDSETSPLLHIAQDKTGAPRELYLRDEVLKACAEELGLKWAQRLLAKDAPSSLPEPEGNATGAETVSEWKKQQGERERMDAIIDEAKVGIATKLAVKGRDALTLPMLRAMTDNNTYEVMKYLKARGSPECDLKAAERFLEKSPADELLGYLFFRDVRVDARDGFEESFVALAKAEGFDLKAMLKARIDGEKSEALKGAKS